MVVSVRLSARLAEFTENVHLSTSCSSPRRNKHKSFMLDAERFSAKSSPMILSQDGKSKLSKLNSLYFTVQVTRIGSELGRTTNTALTK